MQEQQSTTTKAEPTQAEKLAAAIVIIRNYESVLEVCSSPNNMHKKVVEGAQKLKKLAGISTLGNHES